MIGNDIIDLNVSKTGRRSGNARLLSKLFTVEEESFIKNSEEPETALWHLWSMKEAVYKAHQRNFGLKRFFNPKAFECSVLSDTEGAVAVENISYPVSWELTSEFIHSRTTTGAFFQKLYFQKRVEKNRFLYELASEFDLEVKNINFVKDSNGIPWINIQNHPKKWPISLSHHGDFTTFIIPLINS